MLRSVSGKHAAKQFTLRETKSGRQLKNRSYGSEKHFSVTSIPLDGFTDLATTLSQLTKQLFDFVVRGEPLPGINLKPADCSSPTAKLAILPVSEQYRGVGLLLTWIIFRARQRSIQ